MAKIDIGVFAHNEAERIGTMLGELLRQSIFVDADQSVRLLVLANGCTDKTVAVARATIEASGLRNCEVIGLAEGGKSRTWNRFVHDLSRPDADILCFCDADIALPDSTVLSRLADFLSGQPELAAVQSRPVKDIVYDQRPLPLIQRLIAASARTVDDDWRHSICGQLYMARTVAAREFHLPIGLPVEDGFVRAMLLTRTFTAPENLMLIDGRNDVFHVYPSELTVGGLIRHQTRIVIGSAINATLFAVLTTPNAEPVRDVLAKANTDENWVPRMLQNRLPSWRFGWIPWRFLTKRLRRFFNSKSAVRPRAILILVVGFCFDAVVYLLAQAKMARGIGAGYW